MDRKTMTSFVGVAISVVGMLAVSIWSPSSGPAGEVGPIQRYRLDGELPMAVEEVNALVSFVETETGRLFVEPPTIVIQDTADYEAGLFDLQEEELAEFEEAADAMARYFQTVGLSEQGGRELTDNITTLLSTGAFVVGYYDTEQDRIHLAERDLADDEFQATVVHELTHALDDQYVDLLALKEARVEAIGESEAALSLEVIIEGRATSVEEAWRQANRIETSPIPTLTEEEIEMYEAVPSAVLDDLSLPYEVGILVIDERGGPSETWDLYDGQPLSSEQILFADTGDEPIVEVTDPVAAGPERYRGDFGATDVIGLLLHQDPTVDNDRVMAMVDAADGWAGGQVVVWGDDTESCTRFVVAGDDPAELAEIESVLQDWAGLADGRTIEAISGDQLQATACAPYRP